MHNVMQRISGTFSASVALLSFFFAVSSLISLLSPEDNKDTGAILGIFLVSSLLTYGTSKQWWLSIQHIKQQKHAKFEQSILQLIQSNQGKITPEEIALKTNLTVIQATNYLNELCQQGSGGKQVTEDGHIVYVFAGFLSQQQKNSSKDVMES
jgi:hypothetical protein